MKKNAFKLLSVFLSVLMIVMSVPLTAFAADVTDNTTESVKLNTDIIELTDKRTATSKTFRLDDGSYYVAEYDTEIHYLDENGLWQDIDNTLAASGSEFSTNNAKIKFAKKITGNETIFTLHDGNRKLTLSLNGALKKTDGVITNASADLGEDATELQKMTTLEKISASILYADILPSTDLEYVVKGLTVKENIIVKEKADDYTYSFTMKLNNLTAMQTESGEIYIIDSTTGETVYYIPAPIMWDANRVASNLVTMALVGEEGKYTLTVTADAEWMNASDRAYPVTIDPPIYTGGPTTYLDMSVSSDVPTVPLTEETSLPIGNTWHAYWKWLTLPSLPDSAYIVNAEFALTSFAPGGAGGYVGVYDVLTDWDETLTWNTRASGSAGTQASAYTDYQYVAPNSSAQIYTWNVTPIVKKWIVDDLNYGLMLAPVPGTTFTGIMEFHSGQSGTTAARPRLMVRYQDMKGIEDYWSYVSQSVGFAGAGSVNLATGNLVFTIPTLTSMDALMPVSPALVYDSSLAGLAAVYPNVETPLSTAIAANGFKLNLSETLLFKNYGDSNDYLVFSDGDGTEHYFMPTDGGVSEILFVDESGLHHTLAFDMAAGTCTVTDSNHTVKVYLRTSTQPSDAEFGFYLSSVTDKSGNKVTFTVDTNYRVTSATLTPYGSSPIEQLKIAYNAEGFPYVVWNPTSGEGVVFRYTNSNLTSVIRAHGATTVNAWQSYYNNGTGVTVDGTATYTYDSAGRLKTVTNNLTGYQVAYTYTNGKVTSVSEKGGTTTGQTIGITYGATYTEIRTSGADDAYGNSDDLITTYGFDSSGRAVSIYTTDLNRTQIYGASHGQYVEDNEKANNSLKSSTETAQHSSNYLLNGGFESSLTYWSKTGTVSVDATRPYTGAYGAKLTATASTTATLSQTLSLPAGEYTLSLMAYTLETPGLTLQAQVENSSGVVVATESISINEANASETYQFVGLSFDVPTAGSYTVTITASGVAESAWIDNVMLSRTLGAADFDLLENGHFETVSSSRTPTASWTRTGATAVVASGISALSNVLRLTPALGSSTRASQTVAADPKTTIYSVSGWAKGTAQSANPDAIFGIRVTVNYASGTETHDFSFNKNLTEWQFVSGTFALSTAYGAVSTITVTLLYEGHMGVGYFDSIALIGDCGDVYEYNANGYLSLHQSGKIKTWYQYDDNNNLKAVVESHRQITEYVYDAKNRLIHEYHSRFVGQYTPTSGTVTGTVVSGNVDGSVSGRVINLTHYAYTYNTYGLVTGTTVYETYGGTVKTTSSATYNVTSGSPIFGTLSTETNALGQTTRYFYNSTNGRLMATTYPDGNGVTYTYDGVGNLTNVSPATYTSGSYAAVSGSASVDYTYDTALRLSTIETATGTTYRFTYDNFSNTDTIKVGIRTLADYTYNANNGKLNTLTYGNGDKVKYLYDTLDRVAEIQYNNGSNGAFVTVYTYEYDAAGNVHAVHDHTSGEVTVYKYDAENKLVHTYVYDSDTYVNLHGTTITYDDESRVSSISHSYDYTVSSGVVNEQIVYEYGYSTENGSINSYAATSEDNSYYAELTYDNLGRRTERIQGVIVNNANTYFARTSYTYKTNGNSQSGLVASYTTTVTRDYSSSTLHTSTYTFTYDANGNITQVSDTSGVLYKYAYDDLGQLVREDNRALGKSYTFTYDNAGNIKEKKTYAYNTGTLGTAIETVSYTYGDSEWADLLTKYGNTNITYDTIGNPITIGTATLAWQGRQLISYTDNGTTVSYTYNADGIRTSKTITEGSTTTKHEYVLRGGEILQETVYVNNVEQYTVIYIYDENGSPLGMKYRTPSYTADTFDVYVFEKSLQGDIIAIYDDTTAKVVEYIYDAWGNAIVAGAEANTIGAINSFRYRGYYFDSETDLYYVNSRYYNAEWGRFLNADAFLTTGQGLISYNMFAYCLNDPANRTDACGAISATIYGDEYDFLDQNIFEHGGGGIGAALAIGAVVFSYKISEKDQSIVYKDIKKQNDKHPGEYIVYGLMDETGKIRYVGRTKDLNARLAAHARKEKTKDLSIAFAIPGLTWSQARGLEQLGIIAYSTLNIMRDSTVASGLNWINGISLSNPNRFAYLTAAWDFLYNEALIVYYDFTGQ